MSRYHVYFLIDPRNQVVRYVGMSKDPHSRFKQHLRDPRSNAQKVGWIKQLKSLKLKPLLKVVRTDLSKSEAEECELELIQEYSKSSILNLLGI